MEEYYVIYDLETNLYLDSVGAPNIFKMAREFRSKPDVWNFLDRMDNQGNYTIITVYRTEAY